jgi:NADPH-dependent 2,4-dienoyl-CoA reductase/sulfur reductase-like enzyme
MPVEGLATINRYLVIFKHKIDIIPYLEVSSMHWLAETAKGLSEMRHSPRIAIVSGGIGGLTAALALRARGLDVGVLEQAEALTEIGFDGPIVRVMT